VGVIQRQIEAQGVSTVSISLYRPFTEAVKPPRALWVPFPYGRPMGAPNNKAIQRKVIFAALDLLKRDIGPVIEELPLTEAEEKFDARNQSIGKSCGSKGCNIDDALQGAYETPEQSILPYDGNFDAILAELRLRKPYHRQYTEKYGGRTQLGYSGVTTETIESSAEFMHRYVMQGTFALPTNVDLPAENETTRSNFFMRLCADDLKAFYLESRLAQQGGESEIASEYNDWLWFETKMGSLIVAARDRVIQMTDRKKDPNWIVARGMVPRGYGDSGYTMVAQNTIKAGDNV
jgi:hypothetical protein